MASISGLISASVLLLASLHLACGLECTQEGFFRHPDDCNQFYRCVDFWGLGRFKIFNFFCPIGTVFDETISVCNWPYAVPSCQGFIGGGPTQGSGSGVEQPGSGATGPQVPQGSGGDGGQIPAAGSGAGQGPVSPGGSGGSAGGGSNNADGGESVIIQPLFSYQCASEGFFGHEHDCQKFWLCESSGSSLEAGLYLCPDEYLYDENSGRCEPQASVICTKKPDLARVKYEPRPIKLEAWQLDSFFARFGV